MRCLGRTDVVVEVDTSDTLLIVLWLAVCLLGIVLKLAGTLTVSWAIVLIPLWLPIVAVAFIFIILIFSVMQFNRSASFEREDYERDENNSHEKS